MLPSLLPDLGCVKFLPYLGEHTLWDVELQYIFSCRVPECHFDVAQLFIQAHISCTGFHRNTPCCQASCFSHHKLTCFCLVGTLTILSFRGRALELVGVFNISPTLSQQEWNITIFFSLVGNQQKHFMILCRVVPVILLLPYLGTDILGEVLIFHQCAGCTTKWVEYVNLLGP